ncbi:unnamed protein product [Arabidopsis thaliana]|uniref:Uncharacterized protein n=1 Tax=Arabidopsis thaliana TaxID=3702 RepID=A0A5S9XH75_ARATH|nr:unnamed protein product [Arabidopsis thaliana]
MKGVTDWFYANTLISAENQKEGSIDNGKEVCAVNRKGLQISEPQTNPLPISDGDDDFDRFFPLRRSSRCSSRVDKAAISDTQVPNEGLGLDNMFLRSINPKALLCRCSTKGCQSKWV